jgi:hypothetical protein
MLTSLEPWLSGTVSGEALARSRGFGEPWVRRGYRVGGCDFLIEVGGRETLVALGEESLGLLLVHDQKCPG